MGRGNEHVKEGPETEKSPLQPSCPSPSGTHAQPPTPVDRVSVHFTCLARNPPPSLCDPHVSHWPFSSKPRLGDRSHLTQRTQGSGSEGLVFLPPSSTQSPPHRRAVGPLDPGTRRARVRGVRYQPGLPASDGHPAGPLALPLGPERAELKECEFPARFNHTTSFDAAVQVPGGYF